MKIELQPISSIKDTEEWHSIIEMIAIFLGQCTINDLEWDEDELLKSYLDCIDDRELRADYEAEPQSGVQAAKDQFISDVSEMIAIRQGMLGAQSPFKISEHETILLLRKPAAETTLAGLCYAWLSIFWAISSSHDHIIITKNDRDNFVREFSRIFEYICCVAMAARTPSAIWYFGDSRDVREFMKRLSKVTQKIGNGTVKDFANLEENQTGANDAGVDVIAITTRNNSIYNDSTAFLVSATIQKSDRRNKIIGTDQIRRFTSYFSRGPILSYGGMLVIPYPESSSEGLNCRDKNCGYMTKNEIIQNLAQFPSDKQRTLYLIHPHRLLLKKSKAWRNNAKIICKGRESLVDWA